MTLYTKFGKVSKNQTVEINQHGNFAFTSYTTHIATYDNDKNELVLNGNWWECSNTTLYYFKQFIENFTQLEYLSAAKFRKLIEKK